MKHLLILSLLLVPTIALAQQQPTEFTFKVTPADADVIWEGLRELPVKKVEPVMSKLRQQVMEQTQPKAADAPKIEEKKE